MYDSIEADRRRAEMTQYGKYFVTGMHIGSLKLPRYRQPGASTQPTTQKRIANRLMWIDESVIPGAFYSEIVWFMDGKPEVAVEEHVHQDNDEIIAFFGGDPHNPHELNGEVELWIGGEAHIMDKSFVAFIPSGTPHCPLFIRRVDRPIFHFTAFGKGGQYA